MTRRVGSSFLVLALCAAGVFFATRRTTTLFPGIKAAHYRFSTGQITPNGPTITAMEARVAKYASAFDLAELSTLYFQQGHLSGDLAWFDKAQDAADRSLKLLSRPNSARITLAKVADAKHEFEKAIEIAKDTLKEKNSPAALAVLVSSYLALGNLDEAARWADTAVDVQPDISAYLMRALVMAARGRDEEATFDFAHAVTVEDIGNYFESARLRSLWGRFLTKHGDYRGARALFEESLRILPANHLALALWGDMELQRGNYKEAEKLLMDAFSASKQMRYLVHYARAKALGGDPKAAADIRQMAEKMIREEIQTKRFGHRLELVELLLDRANGNDVKEAVELAQEELRIRKSAEAQYFLAKALWAANRADDALEPMRAVLRTGVKDPDYYALAALIERSRGNTPHSLFYQSVATALK